MCVIRTIGSKLVLFLLAAQLCQNCFAAEVCDESRVRNANELSELQRLVSGCPPDLAIFAQLKLNAVPMSPRISLKRTKSGLSIRAHSIATKNLTIFFAPAEIRPSQAAQEQLQDLIHQLNQANAVVHSIRLTTSIDQAEYQTPIARYLLEGRAYVLTNYFVEAGVGKQDVTVQGAADFPASVSTGTRSIVISVRFNSNVNSHQNKGR